MNNRDSLRVQLIDAMKPRFGDKLAESVFQHDIWPVLSAAMDAGELLVARNTTPQKPVHRALTEWLEGCLTVVGKIKTNEFTVSRKELLNVLYQLSDGASQALKDAKMVEKNGTV